MSSSHVLPAATAMPRSRCAAPRGAALPRFESAVDGLVRGGAVLNAGGLAAFLLIRWLGRLDLDAMTLLPAAACLGAAAMSLGTALACFRALRSA